MAKQKKAQTFLKNGKPLIPTLILDEVDIKHWDIDEYNTLIGVLKGCYDKGLLKCIIITSSRTTKTKIISDKRLSVE